MSPNSHLTSDPDGSPFQVILWRLDQLERRLDKLLSVETYQARHDALSRRVDDIADRQDDLDRTRRQLIIGVIVALIAPTLAILATVVGTAP